MSPKAAEVLEQARQLTADEQRELALQLLSALERQGAGVIELSPEWTEELQRRIQDADDNPDDAVDWSDLRAELLAQ